MLSDPLIPNSSSPSTSRQDLFVYVALTRLDVKIRGQMILRNLLRICRNKALQIVGLTIKCKTTNFVGNTVYYFTHYFAFVSPPPPPPHLVVPAPLTFSCTGNKFENLCPVQFSLCHSQKYSFLFFFSRSTSESKQSSLFRLMENLGCRRRVKWSWGQHSHRFAATFNSHYSYDMKKTISPPWLSGFFLYSNLEELYIFLSVAYLAIHKLS